MPQTLADGYTELPLGKIASVVTYLEMRQRPQFDSNPVPAGLSISRVAQPDIEWYREIYRRVGAEWLWFSRLQMTDSDLRSVLSDERVEVFALKSGGHDAGLLELDRRVSGEVEIAYFGLGAELIGKGAGRFLLNYALELAWSRSPQRLWLHTCNLDHPRALQFYLNAGFVPYKFAIEVTDDPRLSGLLPRDAAPQVPLIGEVR